MARPLVNDILLISDKQLTIEFLQATLQQDGFRVRGARNSAKALDAIREHTPDAILCEQRVAGEGVLELLRKLAHIDALVDVPVLILAQSDASRRRGLLREAIRLGASDIIFKPVDAELLVRKLQMQLRTRDLQRQRMEFISMLTRDLNGPITSITGFCQLLLRGSYGEIEEGKIRQIIESIGVAGDRLRRQTSQFLYYTRLESGMLDFEYTKAKPGDLIREAAQEVRAQLNHRCPGIDLDIQTNIPEIVCDPHELATAFKEAFRFTLVNHDEAPEDVRVFAHFDQDAKLVRCQLTDRGLGYTAEQIHDLFDHYETINQPSSVRDAFGMGLYLTKAIVEAHGGSVTLHSVPGEGTTLEIALTILPPNAQSQA